MNKVVAILGIVVLITLGGLFFCAGFFTGTTMSPSAGSSAKSEESSGESGKVISVDDVEAVVDTKSATISEKVMSILSSAAETAADSISEVASGVKTARSDESAKVSIDSLLKEIAASHAENDDCSPDKTQQKINEPPAANPRGLHGKRIVFIGYFKNKTALEIQKVLKEKGYGVHVESSKAGENESFVFCGPFKKESSAEKLLKWLRKHDFSEARLVSVSENSIEETLYDAINEDSGPPENSEKDIPETPLPPAQNVVAQVQTTPATAPAATTPDATSAPAAQTAAVPAIPIAAAPTQ
ncbi:MAG: hypothetical protein LBL99_02505 [Holosporaceae bacterium]|jgi:cell division septation protein DedD|nr:hypothetical protein [Holosporaceae bacterium]